MQTIRNKWAAPFLVLWTGQSLSLLGSSVAQFALVWWVTTLTGSATVLATASLMAILPGVFLGPIAGAYVDRLSRKRVLVAADAVVALAALWLAYLFWSGAMQVWHVYVVMFVRSIGGSFHFPAMQASTTLMVPREHLARVAGLNQALNGVMNIGGPPLGALLLSLLPLYGVMLIDVGTALAAIVLVLSIAIPQPERTAAEAGTARPSIWTDVREGLRYVAGWRGVLLLMIAAMLLNLIVSPALSLMPLLVTRHFQGDALQLGVLESAWGLGVVGGGLLLGVWGGFRRRIYTSLTGVILMGVGLGIMGIAPRSLFWLAVAGNAFAGVMSPIANGPLFAVLQATVAPEYQGRVFTVINSLAMAMMPLGLVAAGPLADWLGIRIWYVIGGVACVVIGTAAMKVRAIVDIEQNHQPAGLYEGALVPVAVDWDENSGDV